MLRHLQNEHAQATLYTAFLQEEFCDSKNASHNFAQTVTDSDGAVYFWAADEYRIYKMEPNSIAPDLIIENAVSGFTIWENGILFLRPSLDDNDPHVVLWWFDLDQMTETYIDTVFSPISTYGDYLVYERRSSLYARKIYKTDQQIELGDSFPFLTECSHLQDVLWIDGTNIWFLPHEAGNGFDTIYCKDLLTGATSQLQVPYGGERYRTGYYPNLPYAVHDGKLCFYDFQNDSISELNLTTGSKKVCFYQPTDRPGYTVLYNSKTGKNYFQNRLGETRCLENEKTVMPLQQSQAVQAEIGRLLITNTMEFVDEAPYGWYYPRTVICWDTGGIVWKSSGTTRYYAS